MALQRLAAFFQDQHQQARGRRKPVILIGPRAGDDGRCLVIGYEATQRMRVSRPARCRACRRVQRPGCAVVAAKAPRVVGPQFHRFMAK